MRNIPEENRPIRFSDVVGQQVPVKMLKAMGKTGNYAPVYVFEGLKGSGKTTDARILARAVNCLHRTPDGEPCCECENCKKILTGEAIDIVEIDAASNNSVADARRLVEEARYKPTELPKKVYILDEAHRMTNEAFDVLLKLLEEPPEWCVFILCTTERSKIRETVLSRAIVLTFKAITEAEMTERLMQVAKKYKVGLDKGGAEIICRHSGGSMRDALTDLAVCLEECIDIDEMAAAEALGVDPVSMSFQLVDAIAQNKVSEIITLTNHYFDAGRMFDRTLLDAIRILADIVLMREGGYTEGAHSPEYEYLLSESKISKEDAIYMAKALSETKRNIADVAERSLLAVELIRIAGHVIENYDAVLSEIAELKKQVAALKCGKVDMAPPEVRMALNSIAKQTAEGKTAPIQSANLTPSLILPSEEEDSEDSEDFDSYAYAQFKSQMSKEEEAEKEENKAIETPKEESEPAADTGLADFEAQEWAKEAEEMWQDYFAATEVLESEPEPVTVMEPDGMHSPETPGTTESNAESQHVEDVKEEDKPVTEYSEADADPFSDFFDAFNSFGDEAESTSSLAKSMDERLAEIKKDSKINSFLQRSEVNVYADGVEVIASGLAAGILSKLLEAYDFIKVIEK